MKIAPWIVVGLLATLVLWMARWEIYPVQGVGGRTGGAYELDRFTGNVYLLTFNERSPVAP